MQNKRLVSLIFAVGIGISSTVTINNLQSLKAKRCTREININTTRDKVENIRDKAKESREYREYVHQLDLKKQMYIEKLEREQKQKEENNKIPVTFEVSFYTTSTDECGNSLGIGASGERVQPWVSIALPSNIPFYSIATIEGLGTFINHDTGSYIKWTEDDICRVDICVNTKEEAISLGRFIAEGYIEIKEK